jgi:polysaccharide biosynthesis/export protein
MRHQKVQQGFLLLFMVLWGLVFPLWSHGEGVYLLGLEDVIEITVWGHQDLQRQVAVSLDGTITFPLVGEVKAAGQSVQAFEKILAAKLADGYLVKPQVTINVKEYKSQKVYIMGEVKNPGTYPVTKKNDLLFILSLAGGFTPNAGNEVMIVRPRNGGGKPISLEEAQSRKDTIIRVNLKAALDGDVSQNAVIQNGDTITVPKMPFFFVLGEVKNPGKYNLEEGTTVLMGISMAGGLTAWASENKSHIVREVAGKKEKIRVKLNDLIQSGDTILVP